MFAGMTMLEHGIARSPVWINDSAHWINCAMTGGGKFTTSLAFCEIFHPGCAVFTSPKPELADFGLGRRVDPRLFTRGRNSFSGQTMGVNPLGITKARYHIPNSRCFVLDPSGQSVYPSARYNPLCEVDIRSDSARTRLLAIAAGSFPDKKGTRTDPWFVNTPRGLLAAGCGHALTSDPNPHNHSLPAVIDMLMGVDSKTGVASPKQFEATLKSMMANNSLDGFIRACASNVYQLGQRAFGNLYSEFENNCRWATDGPMRHHLSGSSEFSFSWLGDDNYPVTVFIVGYAGAKAFQANIPWLRTVSELGLEVLSTRPTTGRMPVLWCGDEYRSWGSELEGVRHGFTILRHKNVKLSLYTQSWQQLEDMFGAHGAAELESCSTMQYFGCNDLPTAERISRRLGKCTTSKRRSWLSSERVHREVELVTPAEVMQELRSSSNLQYVFPSSALPMRLERVAFKPLRTKDGGRFAGLPLEGHYDDGLNKHSFSRNNNTSTRSYQDERPSVW